MNSPLASVLTCGSMRRMPGIAVCSNLNGMTSIGLLVEHLEQVASVAAADLIREPSDVLRGDVTKAIGDLLQARHHQALSLLDALHEIGGVEKRFAGAGVQPGNPATEFLDVERPLFQIRAVDIRDFQLAPG